MTQTFAAQSIVSTRGESPSDRLAITIADAQGREKTVTLSAEMASALAHVLSEFARSSDARAASSVLPTKKPAGFAIGAGRYEPIVLVRFEDDVPYGLAAEEALRLGHALIAEAEQLFDAAVPLRQ
ncbi:MAG: hypothetical protein R3D51_01195 [Hyphomicrobiaceae bacterium]